MSKALLALMRDRSGSNGTVSRSTPQNTPPHPAAPRRNAILSVWPTFAIGAYLLMIAVGFLGDCAAQAGLISAACSFWAFWVFAGVALIFALVSELLERLKLIDKPNKAEPLFGDVFASRQPQRID